MCERVCVCVRVGALESGGSLAVTNTRRKKVARCKLFGKLFIPSCCLHSAHFVRGPVTNIKPGLTLCCDNLKNTQHQHVPN